jgi:hypothetical protein
LRGGLPPYRPACGLVSHAHGTAARHLPEKLPRSMQACLLTDLPADQ